MHRRSFLASAAAAIVAPLFNRSVRSATEPAPCPTCKGEGWMMHPGHDGEMCPDCQNPMILGGTGYVGGVIPRELGERLTRPPKLVVHLRNDQVNARLPL